jgi:hypothetical protein
MNGTVRPQYILLALMMVLVTCCTGVAEEKELVFSGVGRIKLDLSRWTFTTQMIEGTNLDMVTHTQSGKRIIFVSVNVNINTIEEALATIPRLIRGRNDVHITSTPKVDDGALAVGVLANYEVMKVERVAIVIKGHFNRATVFISSDDNPMVDADLLSIKKLVDDRRESALVK